MQQSGMHRKSINPNAYNALVEALTTVHWNKAPYRTYVRSMLKGHPELLAQLDFDETKRETSGRLVNLLSDNEARYLDLTIALMLDLAAMDRFPNLERQPDRDQLIPLAEAAIAELRRWTTGWCRRPSALTS